MSWKWLLIHILIQFGGKKPLLFLKQNNDAMRLFLKFHEVYSNNSCLHPVSSFNNKDVRETNHKIKAIYYIIYRKWNI